MNGCIPDLVGARFGRLLVIERSAPIGSKRRAAWTVRCDCGTESVVQSQYLTGGDTRSCGCLKRGIISAGANLSHGHNRIGERSSTYSTWTAMRRRCNVPTDPAYENYGGRGITICERWETFENFAADMGAKPKGTSIDRIDNMRGYEPGNCRWATMKEQANNRRKRRWHKRPPRQEELLG